MRLSIAIPTFEYKGKGAEFLDILFRTIEIQTFKDFEVVVSDHSKDEELVDVIDCFKSKFDIKYIKNKNHLGNGPANTNNAIRNCSGEIIKVRSVFVEKAGKKDFEEVNHIEDRLPSAIHDPR